MGISKKTIIFTTIFASIFLLLTGLICGLKCCYGEFAFYDFLITIFGGVLASTLVVMACEIQKYLLTKKQTEDELYYHMTIAYANTMIMKNNMDEVVNNPNKPVVKNSFLQCRDQVLLALFYIGKNDYASFKIGQKPFGAFQTFCNNISEIERIINNSIYFDMAINQDSIIELQKNPQSHFEINGTHPNVAAIAKILRVQFQTVIEKCERFMSAIDYSKRYNFEDRKSSLQQRSDIFAQDHSLDSFLKDNLKPEMSNTNSIF